MSFLKESPTESEQIDLDKFKNSLNAVALTAFYQCHLLTDLGVNQKDFQVSLGHAKNIQKNANALNEDKLNRLQPTSKFQRAFMKSGSNQIPAMHSFIGMAFKGSVADSQSLFKDVTQTNFRNRQDFTTYCFECGITDIRNIPNAFGHNDQIKIEGK